MRFRSLTAFTGFLAVALALHLPAVVHAQEAASEAEGARYIEVADDSGSEGSPGQDAGASNQDSSNGDSDSDDSDGEESSRPDGSGHNGSDERFNGPNGALEAVQSDRALPLDGIVAVARHLTDGQIIDTRLHAVKGVLQYELKVLETNNEVRRYSFNARTGKLIKVR